jgi:phospholipid transport system substrate-binding protein
MLKKFIKTVIAVAFLAASTQAQAIDCADPKAFVESVKGDVLNVLNSGASDDEKRTQLDGIFRNITDVNWMGKFVLGRTYNTLTPEQQQQYGPIYADYLSASYVERFKEYNGQTITINQVKPINNDFAVDTTIQRTQKAPIDVTYRVRKVGGCYKVADIIAEGVSLINTQRQEFGSAASRQGFDGLIKSLQDKTQQYKSGAVAPGK